VHVLFPCQHVSNEIRKGDAGSRHKDIGLKEESLFHALEPHVAVLTDDVIRPHTGRDLGLVLGEACV
jgi:hypothetical protein